MTRTATAYSGAKDAAACAAELTRQIGSQLKTRPDAVVLFASPVYDHPVLLAEIDRLLQPRVLVGASSAGEFTTDRRGTGLACALALCSDDIFFSAGVGRGIRADRRTAARELVSGFRGTDDEGPAFRAALVMTDALAGHADDLVNQLTLATSGKYQFFGGGAGDDAQFRHTNVFFGTEALTDAAVALEILSRKPIGIGVGHGWRPATPPLRVTEAHGMRLVSLNGMPAIEAFEQHAHNTGQRLDRRDPMPFFLHNIIGIDTGGGLRLRVPLAVSPEGAIDCAAEVPTGAIVHIMGTSPASAVDAASRAIHAARQSLRGHPVRAALFFDCVATRLRMGDTFGLELETLTDQLGDAPLVGCNTHGQIVRAEGQFGGFHNCTAVVCLLPA